MDVAIALILTYKYAILFPLAVIEGPILTVICGFLASLGIFDLVYLYPLFVVGDTVGDSLNYALGRYGTHGILRRYGERLGMTAERQANLGSLYEEHFVKTVFASKLIHGLGFLGLIAAGSLRLPYGRFVMTCGLVSLLQAGGLLLLGYFFGHAYTQIGTYLNYYAATVSAVVVLIFFTWWLHGKRARQGVEVEQ